MGRLKDATQDIIVGFSVIVGFVSRLVLAIAPAPYHHKTGNAGVVLLPLFGSHIEFAMAVLDAAPVLFLPPVLAEGFFTGGPFLKAGKEFALIFFHL